MKRGRRTLERSLGRGTLGSLLTVAIMAASPTISAQSAAGAASAAADPGRSLYEAGAAAYAAGNFAAAVQALTQAYQMSPRPGVLFSLAQAERQLYTLEQKPAVLRDAIEHYRGYIEQTPQGGRRADAVEVLGSLHAEAARVGGTVDKGEPAKAPTRLMVSTQPKDAIVSIDGVEFHETPVIQESTPGAHVVATRAPGYFDDTRTLMAVDGSLVATEVGLRERPAYIGVFAPDGTEIVLDGKPQGTAPLGALAVAGGVHILGLSLAGHVPQLRTIRVERGADVALDAPLATTAQRSVSYGLLAGGAVGLVTSGAAGVVALVLEANAKSVQTAAAHGNITQARLDSYNQSVDLRDHWRTAAVVSLGIGAVVSATGLLLYAIDHAQPGEARPTTGTGSPRLHAEGDGVSVSF